MGCVKTNKTVYVDQKKSNINNDFQSEIKSDFKKETDSILKTNNNLSNNHNKNINNKSEDDNFSKSSFLKDASEIDDKYFILEKISKNPVSTNYKIQNKKNPSTFKTMKVITKSTFGENDEDKKIIEEIEILKGLKHENVIEIEQCYLDEKFIYIISEFSDYGNLKDQFGIKKKYSENQTKYIIFQLLKAIKYLNQNNFIHTDIKPENILITEKIIVNNEELFNVKLIDFGNSNSLQSPESQNLPYYVAPEVIERKFNEKCDIWSLGIIMFRLIYGYVPFKGNTFEEVINHILLSPIEYDKEDENIKIHLSKNGENLLSNMIVRELDKRFSVENCLNHKWFKNNCLTVIEEEKEKKYKSRTYNNEDENNNDFIIKTQFNKSEYNKMTNTGFYKMELDFLDSQKKTKTVINIENNYEFFLSYFKKFLLFYYRINFNNDEEDKIINEIYIKKENRDLSKIKVNEIYDCVIEYTGVVNNSVRYIVFKQQVKDDIQDTFKGESLINFNSFKKFLIYEKEIFIDIELSYCFEKLKKKNKEEIEMCFDLDTHLNCKTQKYIKLIKNELIDGKIYKYEEFKNLVIFVINKFNTNNENKNNDILSMNLEEKTKEEEKKEMEIELDGQKIIEEGSINFYSIINFNEKKYQNQINPENSKKSKNSYNKIDDPNAFDPEKFLLLVDENYTYNNGN